MKKIHLKPKQNMDPRHKRNSKNYARYFPKLNLNKFKTTITKVYGLWQGQSDFKVTNRTDYILK
jgi:hypothetical protein